MEYYEKYEEILRSRFGFSYLKPYQELVVARILDAREKDERLDLLVTLPTGEGKSICFMLPAAINNDYMVIIYPLLSLMNDQESRFRKAGLDSVMLRGGLSGLERDERINKLKRKESHILIINMEMLLYLMERDELSFMNGAALVLDEVHTIITWGHTFRPSYQRLNEAIEYIKPRSILAFSATIDDEVYKGLVKEVFSGREPHTIHASSDRSNIYYKAIDTLSLKHELISILQDESSRPALVFAKSRARAEELSMMLSRYYETEFYHAAIEKEEKERKEKWFIESKNGVMVATIAFGMGVDKKNIRTVIHSYLPASPFAFIQEAGRAGRDGNESISYILRSPGYMKESAFSPIFDDKACIRFTILKAMGEERDENRCLSCSNCRGDILRRAGERELLRYIKRHPFKLKSDLLFSIRFSLLMKKKNKLRNWKEEELKEALTTLEKEKLIQERRLCYRLTTKGQERLRMLLR